MNIQILPSYVKSALSAERTAQLDTYVALTVWVFNATKADETIGEMGAKLHKAGDYRSLKTWQNYASAGTALASNAQCVVRLESIHAADSNPEAMVAAFRPWLTQQLKAKGHTHSIDDVVRFAKGSISLKAQGVADEQAKIERDTAAAAQALAEAQQATKPVEDRTETKAEQGAAVGAGDTPPDTAATGYAAAVFPPIDSILTATAVGGELSIHIGERATRADLVDILEALQAHIDSMPVEASDLPVIDVEMADA